MSETLGFLLNDVARLLRRRFDERARTSGSSVAQWRVLKILEREPGPTQGHLAEQLEVEPITCSRMIDRLEEAGFVERRRAPSDRRVWRIHLAPAASTVLAELHGLAEKLIEEALQGFSPRQRDELIASLHAIRSNLNPPHDIKETDNG